MQGETTGTDTPSTPFFETQKSYANYLNYVLGLLIVAGWNEQLLVHGTLLGEQGKICSEGI